MSIMSANRAIAEALFAQLLDVDAFHFGSEGILLFRDGTRVGTIDWRDGNKAAVDALCTNGTAAPAIADT